MTKKKSSRHVGPGHRRSSGRRAPHSLQPDETPAMQLLSMVSDIDSLRLTARWIVLRVFPPR
jgi:hypothetical protein